MDSRISFSAITGSLGRIGDRYCLTGYKEDLTFEEKLAGFSKIKDLSGVEISQGEIGNMSAAQLKDMLKKYNLSIAAIGIDLTSEPVWKFGSLTDKDLEIRKMAIEKLKKTMDFAEEMGGDLVNVWLGQEGFDYPFQVNYSDQWNYAVRGIQECADYNRNIRLALEPKPREPRNRSFIDSTATALMLVTDVDRENVGVTIDVGHVLQDGKNMAQAIAYAAGHGKLFNLHANDNYCGWDDDMIVGSVHIAEFIELFYFLRKINYNQWCSVDIFPYREDSLRAVEESIKYMRKFEEMLDLIGMDRLDECLKSNDVTEGISLIRESIFK